MTEAFMPGMKTINGHTYVKVKDLAEEWDTTTSTILATGRPQQIPSRFRRTIDRQAWVSVEKEFLQRFPVRSYKQIGPLMETVHEKNGGTTTIYRSTFQDIDVPSSEELQSALDNRQVIYRYKNDGTQVLAQTLSNYLDTRTSSLLAVNKKQGVPGKFIHREWKRTWVDLEGLKVRVAHTEHGSALLKGLNWVVQYLDGEGKTFDQLVETMKQFESAKSKQKKQQAKTETQAKRCGTREKPCEVAVEANKRAIHNTERINNLATEVRNNREQERLEISDIAGKLFDLGKHIFGFDYDQIPNEHQYIGLCNKLTNRINSVEKQATQNTVDRTLLGDLNTRLGRLATQADRLDGKTGGLTSRVSVLEDTTKWLSWSVATVLSVRLIGFTLHWLRRK